jgi:hypothetical protein
MKMKGPGDEPGLRLFLLLAFRVGLLGVLMGRLRMLLGGVRMFLALGMIALTVMFSGGTMCLGSVLMVFSSFVVFISGHCNPLRF